MEKGIDKHISEEEEKQEKKKLQKESLDKAMKEKIDPVLNDMMHKYLGVEITELKHDLSDKLKKPYVHFTVDTMLKFKEAKMLFKKQYLRKLLLLNFGNISEVARLAGINRRSIHRLIKEVGIDVEKIRKEMVKEYDIKTETVSDILGKVLDNYKEVIHPSKLEKIYQNVGNVSKEIVEKLPEAPMTLDEAEEEFEKEYIIKALKENENNVSKTARKIGLRYETLHRKIKSLGLEKGLK